jgi:hypothetical protein
MGLAGELNASAIARRIRSFDAGRTNIARSTPRSFSE